MARLTLKDLEGTSKEPFELEIEDGKVLKFTDSKALHWTVLASYERLSPEDQMKLLMTKDDYETLRALPEADGAFFDNLRIAYRDHFALPASGEAPASPRT